MNPTPPRSCAWIFSCLLGVTTMACDGTTPDNGGDAGLGDGASPDGSIDAEFPGPHPDTPNVMSYGGPVLTAPKVIPIFFQNDTEQTKIEDFLGQFATSGFWSQTTSEYGVGALSIGSSIVVSDTPPTTIDVAQIESWLVNYLDGTHAEWPAIDINNIYTIIYPTGTTISDPQFGKSCVQFGGFHESTKSADGKNIVFVGMPRCSSLSYVQGFDVRTASLSHEIIEAASDPTIATNPAFALVDQDHFVWNFLPLAEIADMCALEPQSYRPLVGSYMVQRVWSNASAKAGHDPCVPVLSDPYFSAAPVFSDDVNLTYNGRTLTTKGVQVPLNQSKTIPVQLFSDGPTTNWMVQAVDLTYYTGGSPQLKFSWDNQFGNNGDTLQLTITRTANGPYGGSEFIIFAQKGTAIVNYWFGFAAN